MDKTVTARTISSLAEVNADEWDACAGTSNPFLLHAFLSSLEESGSCTAETGWLPQHLLLEGNQHKLIGAMPLYVKGHSQGEYVFDHIGLMHTRMPAGIIIPNSKHQCHLPRLRGRGFWSHQGNPENEIKEF